MVRGDHGSGWRQRPCWGAFAGVSVSSIIEIVHQPSLSTDMAVDIISAASYY
jgi:hypothetical protein